MRKGTIVLALLGATLIAGPQTRAAECREVEIAVTIAPGVSGPVSGTFCDPGSGDVVQILLHGITYSRTYWDFGVVNGIDYSYIPVANAAGYATLAVDRIGIGASEHFPPELITYESNADAAHQLVDAARSGALGRAFGKVVLVGHSYGSMTSWKAAGTYGGVDAIVATGATHGLNYPNVFTDIGGAATFAFLDPGVSSRHGMLPPGYLTTAEGKRGIFYHAPDADPDVIALDEATKETYTDGEHTALLYPLTHGSQALSIPALVIVGQHDRLFCGLGAADCTSDEALAAYEASHLGPDADVTAWAVPDAGHDLNLEYAGPPLFGPIQDWIAAHVG